MRRLTLIALVFAALPMAASAQQVEYVTRGSLGGHAVRFGSSPLRATLPRAYVRVNNAPHATGTLARPLDGRRLNGRLPPIRVVRIHGTDHVIATVAEPLRAEPRQPEAPKVEPTRVTLPKPPAPSRHALMVHALMSNRLDCHR